MFKTSMVLIILALTTGCSTNPYNTPTNNKGMAITQSAAILYAGSAAAGVITGDIRRSTLI